MAYYGPRRSRSPDPHPVDEFLGSALNAFAVADQFKRQRAQDRLDAEDRQHRLGDRNRLLDAMRARDMAQPGARTLAAHLDDPMAAPIRGDNLRRISRADETNVPIEFEQPAPVPFLTGGVSRAAGIPVPEVGQYQDRAAYLTENGVVMDPRAAREEGMLGTALRAQMERDLAGPQPWQPITRDDQIAFERDKQRAGAQGSGLFDQRTRDGEPERIPPMSATEAGNVIQQRYARPRFEEIDGAQVLTGYDWPEGADANWMIAAIQAARRGQQIPDPVPPPPPSAPGARVMQMFDDRLAPRTPLQDRTNRYRQGVQSGGPSGAEPPDAGSSERPASGAVSGDVPALNPQAIAIVRRALAAGRTQAQVEDALRAQRYSEEEITAYLAAVRGNAVGPTADGRP